MFFAVFGDDGVVGAGVGVGAVLLQQRSQAAVMTRHSLARFTKRNSSVHKNGVRYAQILINIGYVVVRACNAVHHKFGL